MGGRDHSCEGCGRGGFNDPNGECECGPTPVPQGLVERARALLDAWDSCDGIKGPVRAMVVLDRAFDDLRAALDTEPCHYCGHFYPVPVSYHHTESECQANSALDTPTESVSGSEVRELREALSQIWQATRYDNAVGQLRKIESIARRALAPDPEGGKPE